MLTRDEGVVLGQDVVIGALGEFRGHAGAATEFIEVAQAGHIFEVEAKGAVRLTRRGGFSVPAAVGRLKAIAALHILERALRLFGVGVSVDCVHGVAIGSPANMGHLLFAAG